MIKRLRRKFVLVVMAVVTLILLAIFFSMLVSTQGNNRRISEGILRQALGTRPFNPGARPMPENDRPPPSREDTRDMRTPILVVEIGGGSPVTIFNQLHFIGEDDVAPLARLALNASGSTGVLQAYALRYMRDTVDGRTRIAFADISMEREILKTQVVNSLLIGLIAMLLFFLLSLFLARWAVRPVEAAWERQKQFIADASHELKTPLTVILSNSDMLRVGEAFTDEKNARRAEHIHAEALRMKRLVEDMLTLAKSDSAESRGEHLPVDFSYAVNSAVLMYEPVAFDEGKRLLYDIHPGLCVTGDPQKLQQALHILLDNAVKYSPAGSVIRARLSAAENRTALLCVENEGEPIPPGELEAVFLRFYRRDKARSGDSFGLGLSIAGSIVSAHRGKIWAESNGVDVNRFYISLPLNGG